ncbi:hypothetical protein GN156_07845 [bacterium LRH843]|nr:hypothetical protein [bacterium LRH843]
MFMIMPFLIVILLLGLIVAFVFLFMGRSARRRGSYYYSRRVKWTVIGYVTVLIVSFVLMSLIPSAESSDAGNERGEDVTFVTQATSNETSVGRIYRIENAMSDRSEWDYQEDQLTITAATNEYIIYPIVIERKETNDNRIEAIFYKGQSRVGEIDFTDQIHPPHMSLAEQTLTIADPPFVDLSFTMFTKEFTITQFTEENGSFFESPWIIGDRLLYLRIPKDVEVIHEDQYLDIQYARKR